jgi:hypothetical protein
MKRRRRMRPKRWLGIGRLLEDGSLLRRRCQMHVSRAPNGRAVHAMGDDVKRVRTEDVGGSVEVSNETGAEGGATCRRLMNTASGKACRACSAGGASGWGRNTARDCSHHYHANRAAAIWSDTG